MKRNIISSAFLIASLCSAAQNPIIGLWEGKINAGMDLRIIFNLKQDENGNYSATMDLPDQGIKGIVSKDVVIEKDSLFITIQDFKGNYKGKRTSDSVISGYWTQGISTALRLKKIEKIFEHSIYAKRCLRELKILRLLQHNNIIQIREVLLPETENFEDIYIVYELMETDLSSIIKSNQELSEEHVKFFLYQILRGLKYIHSANIIHRDLVIFYIIL